MIGNSLTVSIEKDMLERAGKAPPNQVNRYSSVKVKAKTIQRSATEKKLPRVPLANQISAAPKVNMHIRGNVGVDLGTKHFKNNAFEKRIEDVNR